ncbi:MAG: hypothetical protein SWX82_34640 [Cyanobacteriota bacterium]|nr:hypothetical protein [Cyanobacteriota bacterium]
MGILPVPDICPFLIFWAGRMGQTGYLGYLPPLTTYIYPAPSAMQKVEYVATQFIMYSSISVSLGGEMGRWGDREIFGNG